MLSEAFSALGLNDKQQLVYLTLFENGKCSASELSLQTKIPRASVYELLKVLIELGVVSKEDAEHGAVFFANHPSSYQRIVSKEKEQLQHKEQAVRELVDSLSPVYAVSRFNVPRVSAFEGRDRIESMLYEYLPLWRKSYIEFADSTLWGYQDPSFVESYADWHRYMWDTRGPEERICLFSQEDGLEQERHRGVARREVRPLPKEIRFSSSIWIYGEYILMGITSNRPHYAVQIKDRLISANLRSIFAMLWEQSSTGEL